MFRVKDHPPSDDPALCLSTDDRANAGTLLDAADLLALAGDRDAAEELRALGRSALDRGNALFSNDEPGAAKCFVLAPDEAGAVLRLLEKLASVETMIITGDFCVRPEHLARWDHELRGFGFAFEKDGQHRVSLWDEYQGIYQALAVLQTAAATGRQVEICTF
jgi:hypothetical protein